MLALSVSVLCTILSALATDMLGNRFMCKGVIRAGEETIREGKNFLCHPHNFNNF